jgi:hypothetical protein
MSNFRFYGKNFIVFRQVKSEYSLNTILSEFFLWAGCSRACSQRDRFQNDVRDLMRLPFDASYSYCVRQWTGHDPTPQRVDNKYRPIFVSRVIDWD